VKAGQVAVANEKEVMIMSVAKEGEELMNRASQ